MRILSIETSCDDTGIAILETGENGQPELLADLVSSQIKTHAPFGGVVPSLAKREHQKNLVPLLEKALYKSNLLKPKKFFSRLKNIPAEKEKTLKEILNREKNIQKSFIKLAKKYEIPQIDYLAATIGPGLEPALWVGINAARALSFLWNKPIIPVNHIEGHIVANFIKNPPPSPSPFERGRAWEGDGIFPAICLVVSGGHTQLILIKDIGQYEILGETRDDAAGEAFDKVAKMLGLSYPGGPAISREAEKWNSPETKSYQLKTSISLPRPMMNSNDFDFSFSGLKTAVLYSLQKLDKKRIKEMIPQISAEFQNAVIDVLAYKTFRAAKDFSTRSVMLSGGVAANQKLRERFKEESEKIPGLKLLLPAADFCTDNGAMIAMAAYYRLQRGLSAANWRNLSAKANLRI